MSSPERESFEISQNDYDDIFNMHTRRPKMSKNQAIYGLWADEEEEASSSKRNNNRGSKKDPKDYTMPVNFVRGGIKIGDKVSKNVNLQGNKFDDDDDADEEAADDDVDITDSDEEQPVEVLKPTRQQINKSNNLKQSKETMATWERHTKGIGQKLLEKMGHVQGKGLGKNLQGISTPVEAVLRKGRGAIGMYGPEAKASLAAPLHDQGANFKPDEPEFATKQRKWKKGDASASTKQPVTKFITSEELIATSSMRKNQSRDLPDSFSKVKVIDMTGKEQRVLSGYHALSMRHNKPEEEVEQLKSYDLPELLHNLDLLVTMSEDAIIQNNKKLSMDRDTLVNLEHEQIRLDQLVADETQQVERLTEVVNIVNQCKNLCESTGGDVDRSLKICCDLLEKLKTNYSQEFILFDVPSAIADVILPSVMKDFENWYPLEDPCQGVASVRAWKLAVGDDVTFDPFNYSSTHHHQRINQSDGFKMSAYDRLVWEVVVPRIRAAIRVWNVRRPDDMLLIFEHWTELMQLWMVTSLLDQCILPRLQTNVDAWNPLTDTQPIHEWLHPWLPLLGEKLQIVYPPIRQKLGSALSKWHPSDPSAKLILEPWVGVFTESHMHVFVVKHILPKLAISLQQININPHNQILDSWNWVMDWVGIVAEAHMAALVVDNFLTRWLEVLSLWLRQNPDLSEVGQWYQGWKALIPHPLVASQSIKNKLNDALMLMNQAVSGVAISLNTTTPHNRLNPAAHAAPAAQVPSNMKDRIEMRATEEGVLFMPISNKMQDSKQVYRLGNIQMYIDRGLVFFLENKAWKPTASLDTLMQKAQ